MGRTGFRERLRGILSARETPRKTAFTFALGVFIGISPLIGLHTLLGLAAASALGLNRFVVLTGVYVTNPWSVVPIYSFCTWAGMLILGMDRALPDIDWKALSLTTAVRDMGYLLLPFAVGTTSVGLAAAVLSYLIIKRALKR